MKKLLFWCCVVAAVMVGADEVVVNSGETLVLNGGAVVNLRESVVCAKGGSTLKITPLDGLPAGSRGFAAYHGTTLPTDAEWPEVGTAEAEALAAFKYNQFDGAKQTLERVMLYETQVTERQFDLYAAKWTLSEAMTISLFEHMASKVLVILDGTVIFSDCHWNGPTSKNDIAVSAGEHALVVVVATEGQNKCTPASGNTNKNNDGRYGHANNGAVPGLVYNTANAVLSNTNLDQGIGGVPGTCFFQNESDMEAAFTAYQPTALTKEAVDTTLPQPVFDANMRILVDGGEVRLDLSECSKPEEGIALIGGILTTNNGSVVVVGTDKLRVGGYESGGKHWTFYGVPLTFENTDGTDNANGVVSFEEYATILARPPRWEMAAGMDVALMGANLLGDDDVAIDDFDVQLQSAGAVAEGKTIAVGAGRTLSLKPCIVSPTDCWQWYGVEGVITNNITLGGAGALLKLPNVQPVDVVGALDGTGDVLVEYEAQSVYSHVVTTFDSASFSGTITARRGGIAFKQSTPGAAGNTVKLGETHTSYGWCYGWVRLSPAGAGEIETTARIRRVEATTTPSAEAAPARDGRVMVARKQTMQIDTFAGDGCVYGDDRSAAPAECSAEIGVLETNAVLRAVLRKRCSIGRMQMGASAHLLSELESFEADVLEADTMVVVQGPTAVRLEEAAVAELRVTNTTATIHLTLGAGETPNGSLRCLTFDSAATVVLTNGAIQTVNGRGTLLIAGEVRLGYIAPETIVRVLDGGRIVSTAQAVPGVYDLGPDIDPALWLDADAGASTYRQLSFAEHPNVVYTNDAVVIDQWFDVRPGQREYYGWNRRCEGKDETHQQVYPYLLTNSCNGRTTLQFDVYGGRVPGQWGTPFADDGKTYRAGRRLPFNKPITARYAVMVFGSENGGGTSVLGGYMSSIGTETDADGKAYNTPGVLQRFAEEIFTEDEAYNDGSDLYEMARDWSQPLFHVNRPTWVDGLRVDPTQRNVFNGGYQILAFEIDDGEGQGVPVQSLGSCSKVDTSGRDAAGQIYGEVLIFTNTLTTVQRQRVEQYLSRKWGIPLKGKVEEIPPSASVDVLQGGSVTVADDALGAVAYPGASSLTLGGDYLAAGAHLGSVTLTGGTLEIPALALPPTEAQIPTENLRAWYDPDDATRYLKRTIMPDDARPLAVDVLFSKFSGVGIKDGVAYLSGFVKLLDNAYSTDKDYGDRRPWKAEGARGTGPVRTWLDYTVYTDVPVSDGMGNCLRAQTDLSKVEKLGETTRIPQTFRTAFLVTDTSKGGGNPICDKNDMRPTKERTGHDFSAAIWPKGSLAALANGETRLDGRLVDGATQGYTGRPELLTLQTDGSDAQFHAIGDYNGKGPDGNGNHSSEILGEMIFYTTVLDDATRADIEAYLMKKWLGKMPAGYVDWRDATVAGEGSVLAPSPAYLPKFDAAFSGTVMLTNTVLNFDADATGAVTNGLALPTGVTVALPAAGMVNVTGAARVHGAVLVDAGAVALGEQTAGAVEGWTLNLTPANTEAKLKLEDGKLKLVFPSGMVILFR